MSHPEIPYDEYLCQLPGKDGNATHYPDQLNEIVKVITHECPPIFDRVIKTVLAQNLSYKEMFSSWSNELNKELSKLFGIPAYEKEFVNCLRYMQTAPMLRATEVPMLGGKRFDEVIPKGWLPILLEGGLLNTLASKTLNMISRIDQNKNINGLEDIVHANFKRVYDNHEEISYVHCKGKGLAISTVNCYALNYVLRKNGISAYIPLCKEIKEGLFIRKSPEELMREFQALMPQA